MLRLSKLTDYSTVIMSYMACHPDNIYSVSDIASAVGVGPHTASKILKLLARRNLVQSRRGINGGYILSRPPGQISITEIIDAMEGTLGVTQCAVASGLCLQEDKCRMRAPWQRINQLIRHTLGKIMLSDMNQDISLPGKNSPLFIE